METPFQYRINSSGGTTPIVYSASPLPPGLSLDTESGLISGAPTEIGTNRIVIGAANSAGNISRVLTLNVTADPPVISMDSWRFANFGASASDPSIAGDTADPDGDGYPNLEEFNSGTDPLNGASMPVPALDRRKPAGFDTLYNARRDHKP